MSRKRSSLAEDLMNITSNLPWWVGVLLAILSYLILHQFADLSVKSTVAPNEMGSFVIRQLMKTFAFFGQFILPVIFMVGTFASIIKQKRRERLYRSIEAEEIPDSIHFGTSSSPDPLQSMSWSEFEQLIAQFFKKNGFSVKDTPPGPDGGIDLLMKKNGKNFIVQCKHWKKFKVNVQTVREQFGIMHAEGAHGVFIVTSGVFTEDAIQFAKGKNIRLIDGTELRQITKVLISKIHAGKKQDSKFWTSEFDYQHEEVKIDIGKPTKNTFFRNKFFLSSTTITAFIVLTYTTVLLKPDLFPFLDRHFIHEKISLIFPHMLKRPPEIAERYKNDSIPSPDIKDKSSIERLASRSSPG